MGPPGSSVSRLLDERKRRARLPGLIDSRRPTPKTSCLSARVSVLGQSVGAPETHAVAFNDPQLTVRCSRGQESGNASHVFQDGRLALRLEPQHDDAVIIAGRICLNIGEVQIQSEQSSRFAAKPVRDALVFGTRQTLVPDGFSVETNVAEDLGGFHGEILVGLELHALSSSGRFAVPSRANSAA